jgi:PAS domain S-box-containing protein
MGGGIWSMHFIGMLAFSVPGMAAEYDLSLTFFSLVVPILVTAIGFQIANRSKASWSALLLSGLAVGLGIVAMHYIGMAAMQMPVDLSYERIWVAISILIAIGAATVALWLAFKNTRWGEKLFASVVMGFAISGMHYAAMQGARFTPHSGSVLSHLHENVGQAKLAIAIAATTLLILFFALVAAMFDRRFAHLADREARLLRESEERFRSLYQRTPLPLHSLKADGTIEEVSDAWLDLLGYSRDEILGRPITEVMTEDSIRYRRETIWPRLLAEGRLDQVEYRLVTKQGATLDVLMSGRVERGGDGQVLRVLGGVVDITARRQAEEELQQARKLEAVGGLVAGVSHDFNNLLMAVLGSLELARKRLPEDPKLGRLVENAIQAAQRGAKLTTGMLAFARRQRLHPQPVDIADLVRGMADLLQSSVGPRVRINTHFPLGLSSALVDPGQLELALLNLVVNASDAMPEGGTITIAGSDKIRAPAGVGVTHASYVRIAVSDTGKGMDIETLARAREPFFTTKGIGKGTGLGLSMVHGLSEQSGGYLELKSEVGVGTQAEIWLPVASAPARSDETLKSVDSKRSKLSPLSVLVVDDDPLVLQNTVAMLEDLGHSATAAVSGDEALAHIHRSGSFDLVITDQGMPGMTGLQLVERIRSEGSKLPIILATGYAEVPKAVRVSMPVLSKPFDQGTLEAHVSEAMAARRVVRLRS